MLTIYIQSLGKYLFRSFAKFYSEFSILRCMISLHILKINCMLYTQFTRFSPIPQVTFLFCWLFLLLCKMFCFVVPLVDFAFVTCAFVIYPKNHCHDQYKELFLYSHLGVFMVSGNSKRTRNRKGTWTSECIFAISWYNFNPEEPFLMGVKKVVSWRNLPLMEMLWRFLKWQRRI